MSLDPIASRDFYGELLGWHARDAHDCGSLSLFAGEHELGLILPLDPAADVRNHWLPCVHVDDVDTVVRRVAELGGTVWQAPFDRRPFGRQAVASDPFFAHFAPTEGDAPPHLGLADPPPGTFCWDDLLSPDTRASAAFYSRLFAWTTREVDLGDLGSHVMFEGLGPVGGMASMPPGALAPSSWLCYVAVDDVDDVVSHVLDLQGKVHIPLHDVPGVGRAAVVADPDSAMFGVLAPG
jgi:predicted enzyme related to lactoylglutathione lyase